MLVLGIRDFGGSAVVYKCTECRTSIPGLSPQSGGANPGTVQLLQTVKKLCETVQALSAKVDILSEFHNSTSPSRAPPTLHSAQPLTANKSVEHTRILISEELNEMQEREKRVDFLVVRGVVASDNTQFEATFAPISQHLLGTTAVISDVYCISTLKRLFRFKICDTETRKTLLNKAKTLKDSQFSGVYTNKDLTYAQRKELSRHRQAQATERVRDPPPRTKPETNTPPIIEVPTVETLTQNEASVPERGGPSALHLE
ncbi:hypothetical protein Pcinc_001296 [Petrolisthes cinctipes]|uniref:Uncharacterized protein n=1 Tax=Petrolisthes cinctipes TaxID=88211 RepID=A0AAE1GKG0_PETCI|nr:hypothetical protein Pcinc_001296 [Petrolisthes cinctipes]